jgi:hypothetical protein
MYRKIIKAEKEDDLQIQLPKEYLNKEVEVIAFELSESTHDNADEVSDFSDAMDFFSRMSVDMSDFKFNRDEANER